MKTKFSIKIIILSTIILSFLIGLLTFGIIVLFDTIEKPEFIGFTASYMFIWMSLGFISFIINELRSYEIQNGKLITTKTLLGKKTEFELNKVKWLEYDWGGMGWTKEDGIFIQTESKRTIQINKSNFRNADAFIELIKKAGVNEKTMKLNFDTKNLKVFLFFGVIPLILVGVFKWMSH